MANFPERVAFEFGSFRFDPAGRHLFRDGEPVALTPKALDVLTVLVEARGRVVDRDRLMEQVWPGTAVVDSNLTQTVSVLRKALADTANEHRYIATVPGRGYQFTAPVEAIERVEAGPAPVSEGQAQACPDLVGVAGSRWSFPRSRGGRVTAVAVALIVVVGLALVANRVRRPLPVAAEAARSLAVLPLGVVTPDSLDPALGVGLTDAIINRLSNQGTVAVRPTQTVLPYVPHERGVWNPFQVGHALEVDLVITGTVRRSEDQVRVSIQLLDVARQRTVWAEAFDQPADSLFRIEDQVSERIGRDLALDLLGTAGRGSLRVATEDGEAYRQWLLGRESFLQRSREGYLEAIQHFEKAIERDPGFAVALAHLAMTRALTASNGHSWTPSRRLFAQASVEAERAIEIDSRIPEAHIALAVVRMNEQYDWAGAVEELERALALDPANTRGRYLLSMALMLEGEDERAWQEALRIDQDLPPVLQADSRFSFGVLACFLGRWEEARRALARGRATAPDKGGVRMMLGISLYALGRREEALEELETARVHYPSSPQATATLAHYLGRSDDPAARTRAVELLAALEEKPEDVPASLLSLAVAHAGAGSRRKAVQYLWRAHEAREILPITVQRDPRFEPLRTDPEFERLLVAMHLAPPPDR